LLADRPEHGLDGAPPVGVERAAEVRDFRAGEPPQHPVDEPRRQCPSPRVLPHRPPPARHVGPGLDRRDQPRDVLGRVLQVGVHGHDDVAVRPRQAGVHRRVLAKGPLETHDAHPLVLLAHPGEQLEAAVCRAVVDEDQLERVAGLLERGPRASVELVQRRDLVQQRHDDRHLRIRRGQFHDLRHCSGEY
jgi:hypothetical protein